MMEFSDHNPLHDRPEHDHAPEPQDDNMLDKSSLDFKNGGRLLGKLQDRKTAAEILSVAHLYQGSDQEGQTPLQVFGVLLGSMRRKQDLTLEEAAERAGFALSELFALEMGELPLEAVLDRLPALGKALGQKTGSLSRVLVEVVLQEDSP